jgi:sugar phosphate isomerase/epimerase
MKLGFITACLPQVRIEELVPWAAQAGYEALEVAAWPNLGDRPFTATHLDVNALGEEAVTTFRSLLRDNKVEICSVSYYDNNLHPDVDERSAVNRHVHACIEAAAAVGSPTVGTFVGRDPRKSVKENLLEAEEVFAPLVRHADEVGVKLVIENCVMEGWHPDGYPGNLAYSPELWEWMFGIGLYLNYDPSHLLWMGIDPVEALVPYIDRIPLAQAKDIQLFPEQRTRWGWPGKSIERDDPWDVGWWRYRVPGLGEVDWPRIVDTLYEHGYEGVLSVEHEDPIWGGTEEKVKVGLEIAHRTLQPLVVR